MFAYWRGEMEIEFVFSSSPLIRTRIGINVYAPGTTVGSSFVSDGSIIAHVVEVAGSTSYHMKIPYLFNTKFAPITFPDVATGCEVIYFILDGPYGPSTTVPAPYVNLFMRAVEDMELAGPTTAIIDKYYQVQGFVDYGGSTFGERIDSLTQLAKRTVHVYDATNSGSNQVSGNGTSNYMFLPEEGFTPQFNMTTSGILFGASAGYQIEVYNVGWSFHSWIRQSVLGYSGGNVVRLNAVPQNSALQMVPTNFPFYVTSEFDYVGTLPITSVVGAHQWAAVSKGRGMQMFKDSVAEIVFPDYSIGQYKTVCLGVNDDAGPIRCMCIKMDGQLAGVNLVGFSVSMAGADDVRYGEFMPMTITLNH